MLGGNLMTIASGEIASKVFCKVEGNETGEFSMDRQMLAVMMRIDGKKSLAVLSEEMGLNLKQIRDIIIRLIKRNLIEPTSQASSMIDGDFLACLKLAYSKAVGPIAQIIIEDTIADMGYAIGQFPVHQAAELIDLLSRDIQREDKALIFKQQMIQKIKEKRY
jgi:hypothetical protein